MNDVNIFSMVPIEMLADRRLTLWHMRVLIALLSFRAKNTDHVWPSREALAERCGGMHANNVTKVTSELCKLGWLTKIGDGGRSRSARYRITVPDLETQADSATVYGVGETQADSASETTETQAESASETQAESARGLQEQTREQTNKINRPPSAASKSQQNEIEWDEAQKIFTNVTDATMQGWEAAFPGLDIDGELTRAELWYDQNPKKRKRLVKRFITGWLSRAFADSKKPKVFAKKQPPEQPNR